MMDVRQLPNSFVQMALKLEWFRTDMLKDLIELIALYFCVPRMYRCGGDVCFVLYVRTDPLN